MKPIEHYVPAVLYTMLYKGAFAFEFVGKFLRFGSLIMAIHLIPN